MATRFVTEWGFILTVLYITQNGVTDHIGRSQVAPYVLGLAKRGFAIHVLSAEKPGHEELIQQYQCLFDDAGVRWTRVPYRNRPPVFGQASTQFLMKLNATRIVRNEGIQVIHCRSFPPALIGHHLKKKLGIKYIFDFRDFYADGGIENSRGLARLAYHRLKQLEGPMIRSADKIVCLNERTRDLLTDWYLREDEYAKARFQVIPCCADFEHFDPTKVSSDALRNARSRTSIESSAFVLLYLGSLGQDYLLQQMIALFRQVAKIRPDARFLFVSNNGKDMVDAECARQGVSLDAVRFISADRNEIPAFIAQADMSVFFYREGLRSVGCSPTKLAELFACNVPVIANTGVGDLDRIIDLKSNGSVIVKDFSEKTLRSAVEQLIAFKQATVVNIRENSREFALESGVARYAVVYQELLKK